MKIEFLKLNYYVCETMKEVTIVFNRVVSEEEKDRYFLVDDEFFYKIHLSFAFLYFMDKTDLPTIYKLSKEKIENMVDEGGISTKEINKASLFLYEMVLNAIYAFKNEYNVPYCYKCKL